MSGTLFIPAILVAALTATPALPAAADTGRQALAVFTARCATCHGPDVQPPKGRFGYVLDLKRLANDADKVTPGNPDTSDLWLLVKSDNMPPNGSPTGPLTASEKEAIRAWIAAGAPAALPLPEAATVGDAVPTPGSDSAPPAGESGPGFVTRTLWWVGKFHLLILHFPIVLVLAAAALEAWAAWRKTAAPLQAVHGFLAAAAVLAVPTTALGWLHAWGGHGLGVALAWHRWLGTAACVAVVLLALGSWVDDRRRIRTWPVRVGVFAVSLLISLAAHFGGVMVHGADFLDW